MKQCGKCKQSKSITEFNKFKYSKDGHSYRCRVCNKSNCKAWLKANPEKNLENGRRWRTLNKSKDNAIKKKWRNLNKELNALINKIYYENNKSLIKQKARIKSKMFPEIGRVNTSKYNARKLKAIPAWLTVEHNNELKNIYKNCPKGCEVDHIIPLRGKEVSGLHVPWNLQYLSIVENRKKGNKL